MKIFLLGMGLWFGSLPHDPLAAYRWKNRILLLFAADDAAAEAQRAIWKPHTKALAERQVVLIVCLPRVVEAGMLPVDALQLRKQYQVDSQQFVVVLVGKDGGEKARWKTPVAASTILELIDTMPMRQAEMRRH
jgi:hypothetical protein